MKYAITTRVNGHVVTWRQPIDDPFVHHRVHIGWRDLLRSLLTRRRLEVAVLLDGDRDTVEAVMRLNQD